MLPAEIAHRLSESLGGAVIGSVTPISGGMINHTARVDTDKGAIFLKWHNSALAGMFEAEANGLAALRISAMGLLRIPEVLKVSDTGAAFLAMEYIEPCRVQSEEGFSQRLAEGLAGLHERTLRQEEGVEYGFSSDGFIGMLPQPNKPSTTDWITFYRDCRLLPQIGFAREGGHLYPERERLLDTVLKKLPDLLEDMPPESSLLHGDLWSGNFLCAAGDEPVLIDPAAYNGPREMEIAFIELFGGFPSGFVETYSAVRPLDSGYLRRRPLHQLYPLMVHLNHFGGHYGPAVERACRDALRS